MKIKLNLFDAMSLASRLLMVASSVDVKGSGKISDQVTLYSLLREALKQIEKATPGVVQQGGYSVGINTVDSPEFQSIVTATQVNPNDLRWGQ